MPPPESYRRHSAADGEHDGAAAALPPVAGDFVIRNGGEFFNRPIYGHRTIDFRVDAGDLPEFSLYLPGHGGNLKLGVIARPARLQVGAQADEVVARYRPGRMIYEIRDAPAGKGMLRAEVLTAARAPAAWSRSRAGCARRHAAGLGLRRRQRQEGPAQWRHRLRA